MVMSDAPAPSSPVSALPSAAARDPWLELLDALDLDPARAARRYVELRGQLVARLRRRGCAAADDLVDEAIERVARRIAGGVRPRDLERYASGVARFVALEARGRASRHVALDAVAIDAPAGDAPGDAELVAQLRRCLDELRPEARELLLRYADPAGGGDLDGRDALARELGIGANALRLRVHRLRRQLSARLHRLVAA
jgi:DNA-directed RNA polymerase specialized sigma24 family protein